MLGAGEFNIINVQDALKPTLFFLTAIFINELEVLRHDCLQVREIPSLWVNIAVRQLVKDALLLWP
jgi:hypothetical protein